MLNSERLLRYEVFPSELPPCFTTNDLADKYVEAIDAAKSFGHGYSIPLSFSGYKTESSRRKFAVPNPYHYCKIVDFLVENEKEIERILKRSSYSLTAPIDKRESKPQPYAKRSNSVSDTKREIEKLFQDNRYEIRLDISSFFNSIYTHSIPWAIHGIEVAKRERQNPDLWGNGLDKLMRNLNYDQTNGILVGNAVSRIVSEIILCTIDAQIQKKFPGISCCRFVDDYYIYAKESQQIQPIISQIRTCLAQYELALNENKIQISESPFLYGKPWVEQIKQYLHLEPEVFLSRLIIDYNKYKDISILKYGLKVIQSYKYNSKSWPAMQSRMLNLWTRFPSLANCILPILWGNKLQLQTRPMKRAIYSVIDESLLLNHGQELIWAVWFVKIFNISISQEYMVRVLSSSNDLAIIIMLDIIFSNKQSNIPAILAQRKNLRTELSKCDKDDDGKTGKLMWSSHWLLAYEATRMRWLNCKEEPAFDFARKNQFFSELLKLDVGFYDSEFSYDESQKMSFGYEYATRKELYSALSRLRKSISSKAGELHKEGTAENIESDLSYQEVAKLLESSTDIY